jgi:competence protein ComEA
VSDALSALRGDARVGLAVLVAVAVVAGVVWYRVGSGGAATAQRSAPSRAGSRAPSGGSGTEPSTEPSGAGPTSDPAQAVSGSGAPSPKGNRVVVHVAGAVARPGVVELASGSRVIDAVEAAGGGLPEADLDRLNLAAKIVDGQRVLVQKVGDPPAAAEGAGTASGATPGAASTGPLNLNTATLDQLDGLPGIGPVLAAAILAERVRRGAFKSVNELREVRGIGEQRFADLRELVAV